MKRILTFKVYEQTQEKEFLFTDKLEKLPVMDELKKWCVPVWITEPEKYKLGVRTLVLNGKGDGDGIIDFQYNFHTRGNRVGKITTLQGSKVGSFNKDNDEGWERGIRVVNLHALSVIIVADDYKINGDPVTCSPGMLKKAFSGDYVKFPLSLALSISLINTRKTVKRYVVERCFAKDVTRLVKYLSNTMDMKGADKIKTDFPAIWEKVREGMGDKLGDTLADLGKFGF